MATLSIDDAKLDAASELLEKISGADSESALVLGHRAWVATLRGRHEQARKLIDDARKRGGASALVAREAGRLALRCGDFDTALTRLNEASSNESRDEVARLLLRDSALKAAAAGKTAKPSVEEIITAIEKDFAARPEVNLERGMVAVAKKQSGEALVALAAARSRMSELRRSARELAEVDYYLGRAHYIAGDLKKARESLAAAVKRNPGHADAYYFIGQIEFESENFAGAVAAYSKSVDADPAGNPRAWFYLGDVSHVLGRDADAKKALKSYIERFPNGSDIEAVKKLLAKL